MGKLFNQQISSVEYCYPIYMRCKQEKVIKLNALQNLLNFAVTFWQLTCSSE